MSFLRHRQIYQSDVSFKARGDAVSGSAPRTIVLMSLRPAIPRRVGLHQSPPPLHQPVSMLNPPAENVNHPVTRAEGFSTGRMRNFQPELTQGSSARTMSELTTAELENLFKGRSPRRLQEEFPALRKRYWGQY